MVQFKVYGQRHVLVSVRAALSEVLHAAAVDVLGSPPGARFQRFFALDAQDFPIPDGRSARYTIVEAHMMTGRTVAAKKAFYARLYVDAAALGIDPVDLEITLVETPAHDWAIRGMPGDDLAPPGPGAAVSGPDHGGGIGPLPDGDRLRVSSGVAWERVVGYSRAVRVGSRVAVAGTTAAEPGGGAVGGDDPAEQTREAIRRIAVALEQVGARLEHVVRTRIFVTDISRWEEVGRAHGEFFAHIRPASSMIQVSALIDPSLQVEVEADAIVL